MPSKKHSTAGSRVTSRATSRVSGAAAVATSRTQPRIHQGIVYSFLVATFLIWLVYRSVFRFPVWFDESIGKAIFLGVPVWLFVMVTQLTAVGDSFSLEKLKPGLLRGLAFGGLFGFIATTLALLRRGGVVVPTALFASEAFWGEFALALMTGFWETLFFFSFVMTVMMEGFKKWSLVRRVIFTSVIFLLFHLPNIVLRFSGDAIMYQAFLLSLFAVGQALVFAWDRNSYTLVLTHAFWGMVLLIHF